MSAVLVAIISAVGVILNTIISKRQDKKLEKIETIKSEFKTALNDLKRENSKTYLTDFITDLENGEAKSEIQIQRACEIYNEYTGELNGNSYIHKRWTNLEKKGML